MSDGILLFREADEGCDCVDAAHADDDDDDWKRGALAFIDVWLTD